MRRPQPLPPGAALELSRLLQSAPSQADYQRVLCLWLRAALDLPAAQVATALGWQSVPFIICSRTTCTTAPRP
jgi:hypothetical protein